MKPEEFKSLYMDTHMELQVLEKLNDTGTLIKDSPGDKNITRRYKIPGKALIESIEMEKRADGLSHCLMDAIGARVGDLMDIPMEKLVALGIKTLPQKVDSKMEHTFTFADMVKKASLEVENYDTIDEQ
jgi:hypothetical protein